MRILLPYGAAQDNMHYLIEERGERRRRLPLRLPSSTVQQLLFNDVDSRRSAAFVHKEDFAAIGDEDGACTEVAGAV